MEAENTDAGRQGRYARQTVLEEIGTEGQGRLAEASVAIMGCGALGTHQATWLARAGVGRIRLVDRDVVELDNLHRQLLYDESDVEGHMPKVEAAARRLREINSQLKVEPRLADINAGNVEQLIEGFDVVLDATDNFETRYLLNDACVAKGIPWIYGGVLGTGGLSMTIIPGSGPCLRCLFPEPPAPGTFPTCETAGVLNTAVATVAARQVTDALRLIVGGQVVPRLFQFELWRAEYHSIVVERDPDCPCCSKGRFDFLHRQQGTRAEVLCGRNSVQISTAEPVEIDLQALAQRLEGTGRVQSNPWLLVLEVEPLELWIFRDGRVIVKGTSDVGRARAAVARYLGS